MYKTLWSLFVDGVQLPQGYAEPLWGHSLPEIPGKGEMTLKPSSGFELEDQPSYYQI